MFAYNNFQSAYVSIVRNVVKFGKKVTVRGLEMREIIPVSFAIKNPRERLLNLDCRKNIKRYIFGELLWYLSGRDDVEFIDKYSKVWRQLSDDGVHSNSAYGKYIFGNLSCKGEGVRYTMIDKAAPNIYSQWEWVKKVLTKDPYSRQAVIHIKPIQMYETKDVTCTYTLQFFIRDGELDMIANMRSNDLLFGTTYDVFMFTFLQELMAAELGVKLGKYIHIAANMHYYVKDSEKIKQIYDENALAETFKFEPISADFRSNDLPILLKLEKQYWDGVGKLDTTGLSPLGKQLLSFLTGGNI